jgi:hypothetical protein
MIAAQGVPIEFQPYVGDADAERQRLERWLAMGCSRRFSLIATSFTFPKLF